MPKHLYLLRHAEAVAKGTGQRDHERELSAKGVREAALMGAFMLRENFRLDMIVSSSASRTQQTTQLVAEAMKLPSEKITLNDDLYEASMRVFLDIINNLDDAWRNVMCVGHNPTISYLAEYLTGANIGDMTTGGVAVITFDISSWREVSQGNGELVRYITRDDLLND